MILLRTLYRALAGRSGHVMPRLPFLTLQKPHWYNPVTMAGIVEVTSPGTTNSPQLKKLQRKGTNGKGMGLRLMFFAFGGWRSFDAEIGGKSFEWMRGTIAEFYV